MVTYSIRQYLGDPIIELVDPVFSRPWYLSSYRKGLYKWTSDPLYAKTFSDKAASRHLAALQGGAQDEGWKKFSDMWKAAFEAAQNEEA